VLGIVILAFALGLRKGLLGFLTDLWARRAAGGKPQTSPARRAA
jgi:hypothetical protein